MRINFFHLILLFVILLTILAGVIFLTLQGLEDIIRLIESIRTVDLQSVTTGDSLKFSINIYSIKYIIVELFAETFVNCIRLNLLIGIVFTCVFGILDEKVKILISTRVFSLSDLV